MFFEDFTTTLAKTMMQAGASLQTFVTCLTFKLFIVSWTNIFHHITTPLSSSSVSFLTFYCLLQFPTRWEKNITAPHCWVWSLILSLLWYCIILLILWYCILLSTIVNFFITSRPDTDADSQFDADWNQFSSTWLSSHSRVTKIFTCIMWRLTFHHNHGPLQIYCC